MTEITMAESMGCKTTTTTTTKATSEEKTKRTYRYTLRPCCPRQTFD